MRTTLKRIFRVSIPFSLILPLLVLAIALAGFGGYAAALRATSPCPLSHAACAGFTNFWKSWQLLSQHYVDPAAVDPQEMTEGAIEGMIDSLADHSHTRYLSPEAARAEREWLAGHFVGIGAYIDVRDEMPLIVRPIEGSPAERAGLRPDDQILRVDGQDVRGITVDELQAKIRGLEGTPVTLTIRHEGEELPIDVTITRQEIDVPSVSWRMLANDLALVRISQFSQGTAEEVKQALAEAKSQDARGIVLDLRNNPGGLVHELVGVASQFLPPDTTVLLEENRAGERTPYKTTDDPVAPEIPLVVLVNHNSVSSAEILAGALQEHDRATLVGVPTFGTATVLRTFELGGGAELRIGTTQWLTPDGREVRGRGIQPGVQVALPPGVAPLAPAEAAELSALELRQSEDAQLVRAIEILEGAAHTSTCGTARLA
jgi:carboxyl-terminal processing protease